MENCEALSSCGCPAARLTAPARSGNLPFHPAPTLGSYGRRSAVGHFRPNVAREVIGSSAPIPAVGLPPATGRTRSLASHRRLRRRRGSVRVTPRQVQRPGRWRRPDHSGLDQYAERPSDNLIPEPILTLRRLTVGRRRDDEIKLRPVGKDAAKAEGDAFVVSELAPRIRPVNLAQVEAERDGIVLGRLLHRLAGMLRDERRHLLELLLRDDSAAE
jgi:hypothetical protein